MNNLRNQVQLIGRLGITPELKTLDSGKSYVNLSIATNEYYKDKKGEAQQITQWHKLSAWGRTAENICKIANKGDELAVEGKLNHRTYVNADGQTQYITEVLINEFILLGTKEKNANAVADAMPF